MAKDGSVAPKERVNITYKSATGDAQEDVELPMKSLVLGDFTLRDDDTPLGERTPISVDKENFNEVLAAQDVKLEAAVDDRISDNAEEEAKLHVDMEFKSIKDFDPEAVAEKVPELKRLLELREALQALKGPMGNVVAFRKKIEELVADEGARERIMKELNIDEAGQ